jgi:hypothetical protein
MNLIGGRMNWKFVPVAWADERLFLSSDYKNHLCSKKYVGGVLSEPRGAPREQGMA